MNQKLTAGTTSSAADRSLQIRIGREIERITALMETDLIRAGRDAGALTNRFPSDFNVLMFFGFVSMRMRRRNVALQALKKAARFKPNDYFVHFNIGLCLMRQNRLGMALQAFKKATRAPSKNTQMAHVVMAICHHRLGRPRDAARILRKHVRRYPSEASVRYALILALRDIKAHEEADRHVPALLKLLADGNGGVRRSFMSFFQNYDHAIWDLVDNKISLHRILKQALIGQSEKNALRVPDGYVMPEDYAQLVEAHADRASAWIVKPENLHTGQGIRLIDKPEDAPREAGWIVQRYLDNPLLIHRRKANFRLCIVITSYSPLRVYLYRGMSARLALQEYDTERIVVDRMAMHIDQRTPFLTGEYEKELKETEELTGSKYNVVQYSALGKIIEDAGHDIESLWDDFTALVTDLVKVMEEKGILHMQFAENCAHAYFPKVLSLDIFVDDALRPWLLEVERIPAIGRMFDGQTGDNPVFLDLFNFILFPYTDLSQQDDSLVQRLRDREFSDSHAAKLEEARRGRFMPVHIETSLKINT